MSRFRKIVEYTLQDIRFEHENIKRGNKFAAENTSSIYNWILDTNTIDELINTEKAECIINNIPIVIEGNSIEKFEIGYSLEDKKIHVLIYELMNLIKNLTQDSIFHELIHYYHDIILKANIEKEYHNAEENPELYYNNIEELSTYYSELISYLSKLLYELFNTALKNKKHISKDYIINTWLPWIYYKINTDETYNYNYVFKYVTPENKQMIFDNLISYFDNNLQESTLENNHTKIIAMIKEWENDPKAQARWVKARVNGDKVHNSPYWRTHSHEYLTENKLSVEEIYEDLKKVNLEECMRYIYGN